MDDADKTVNDAPAGDTASPDNELEKGFKDSRMLFQASKDAHAASIVNKPMLAKPHKATLPSPEEHASRASMYSDFTPAVKKSDTGWGGEVNMSKDEVCKVAANGQWSLDKAEAPAKPVVVPKPEAPEKLKQRKADYFKEADREDDGS